MSSGDLIVFGKLHVIIQSNLRVMFVVLRKTSSDLRHIRRSSGNVLSALTQP